MLARAGVLLAAAARCEGRAAAHATATFASSTAPAAGKEAAKPGAAVSVAKDWKAVQLPKDVDIPAITEDPGQGFLGDIRSTSGLGMGDGLKTHTDKWLQGDQKSPMDYISGTEPIKVSGAVVASYGSDDPALGCPVEYIDLRGTSKDKPAVCKYTGNKYYSEDWKHAH